MCLTVVISGKGLEAAEEARLIQFPVNNQDVFAWFSVKGVSRDIMQHTHKVNPKIRLRKQRLRTLSEDRK